MSILGLLSEDVSTRGERGVLKLPSREIRFGGTGHTSTFEPQAIRVFLEHKRSVKSQEIVYLRRDDSPTIWAPTLRVFMAFQILTFVFGTWLIVIVIVAAIYQRNALLSAKVFETSRRQRRRLAAIHHLRLTRRVIVLDQLH